MDFRRAKEVEPEGGEQAAMNPNREELLFQLALTKPVGERVGFLDRECGGDSALRARLEALLAAHEQTGAFMDVSEPVQGEKKTTVISSPLTEEPGAIIGRYKLLEKVGEGGFGVVYVAEQKEPVKRRVALKIIKLGMDTNQVIAHFEAERPALDVTQVQGDRAVYIEDQQMFLQLERISGFQGIGRADHESLRTALALFGLRTVA